MPVDTSQIGVLSIGARCKRQQGQLSLFLPLNDQSWAGSVDRTVLVFLFLTGHLR